MLSLRSEDLMSNLFDARPSGKPVDPRKAVIAELRALTSYYRAQQATAGSLTTQTTLGWCAARVEERLEELESGAPLRV